MAAKGNRSMAKVFVPVLALLGVGLVAHFGFDWPAMDGQAAGTIAPAQRYQAPQFDASDVVVNSGTTANVPGVGGPQGAQDAQSPGANSFNGNSANNGYL